MTISPDDGNFKTISQARGVLLEDLVHALGAAASDMVVAICKDKYRGHYSRAYLSAHHPVLVMELDGKPLPGSTETEADDPGPYLIAHVSFPRTSRDRSKTMSHKSPGASCVWIFAMRRPSSIRSSRA